MKPFLIPAAPVSSGQDQVKSSATLRRVAQLLGSDHPDQALQVLNRSRLNSPAIQNARGVCLMRLGRYDDALRLFRSLVLAPGCTWEKPDLPVIYRTNFATVLLLTNRRAGALDTLLEMPERDHPVVVRLRAAIERWVKALSWKHRLAWKIGLEPAVPVVLDFPAGDLDDSYVAPDSHSPPTPPLRQAA